MQHERYVLPSLSVLFDLFKKSVPDSGQTDVLIVCVGPGRGCSCQGRDGTCGRRGCRNGRGKPSWFCTPVAFAYLSWNLIFQRFQAEAKAAAEAVAAAADAAKKEADNAIATLKAKIVDVKDLVVGKSKTALERVKNLSPAQKKKVAAGVGVGVFAGVGWFGVMNQGTPAPQGKK